MYTCKYFVQEFFQVYYYIDACKLYVKTHETKLRTFRKMSISDGNSSIRSHCEISDEETVGFSIDLVAASKRNLGILKLAIGCGKTPPFLKPLESIFSLFI